MNFDPKLIEEETDGKLKVLEVLPKGVRVYNEDHQKENLVTIETRIDAITSLILNGWQRLSGRNKWIFRAPEIVISDLSEISSNPTRDLHEVYTFHKLLKKTNIDEFKRMLYQKREFHNLGIAEIGGIQSCPEYRIAATDKRGFRIPAAALEMFKSTKEWGNELEATKKIIGNREIEIVEKSVNKCSDITKNFYEKTKREYTYVLGTSHSAVPDNIISGYSYMIPKKDVYIFVPRAGLKYAFGFAEDRSYCSDIMLWECHIGPDLDKEMTIFEKDLKGKKVAIIDRSYSSNTLAYLSKEVEKQGGEPYTIALFPKSKAAIENCDAFIYLDKIFYKDSYSAPGQSVWYDNLFIKTVNDPHDSQKTIDFR